ncbi:MAG TPA: hypothetical protein VNL38_00865 [Candidatus Nitrosotenuis sp.]|nr:hypothetical protein [Candidatus Nitrosotenuis sp.]
MNADKKSKHETRKSKFVSIPGHRASSFVFRVSTLLSVLICIYLWLMPPACAQEGAEEIVANLSAGRVVIFVARDAILVAAHSQPAEPDARPPVVVQLSQHRIAILLGATEWVQPGSGRAAVRLERELPKHMGAASGPPKLAQAGESGDIEALGMALLEPLRRVAQRIHGKLGLAANEPLVEMIVVGYAENYGPEVWRMKYRIAQDPLRGDYWQTRILRPSYEQLYPPEKGQPRTLVEVRYPGDAGPSLKDLFAGNDPRIVRIGASSTQAALAAEKLSKGESNKANSADALLWLRPAMNVITPQDAEQMIAVVAERSGFEWVLAPRERPERAEEKPAKAREPGAPTLRKP